MKPPIFSSIRPLTPKERDAVRKGLDLPTGTTVGRATGGRPRDPLPAKVASVLAAFARKDVRPTATNADPFKRFWLFASPCYYPSGGMEDFVLDLDSVDELFLHFTTWRIAEGHGDGTFCEAHIYDSFSRKIWWKWAGNGRDGGGMWEMGK